MALTSGASAPYAPPTTTTDVLRRYRDRGLPHPVTTEVLERAGVSETLSQRTLHTLKLLGFFDAEGNPTPEFEAANRAPEADYKERLGELITDAYSEVISFADPATDSYERVRDAFRGFNPRSQQDRMVTLFLGLLDYVGLDTSTAAASRRRGGGTPGNGPLPSRSIERRATNKGTTNKAPEQRKSRTARTTSELPSDFDGLPPGLIGLLRQIPPGGSSWTTKRRDAFIDAFRAVLDFSVPVKDDADGED